MNKHLHDFDVRFLHIICVFESLRRFGFANDQIYINVAPSPDGTKFVGMIGVFKEVPEDPAAKQPDFVVSGAIFHAAQGWDKDKINSTMQEAGETWNNSPEAECLALLEAWRFKARGISVAPGKPQDVFELLEKPRAEDTKVDADPFVELAKAVDKTIGLPNKNAVAQYTPQPIDFLRMALQDITRPSRPSKDMN
jgi:hypothetical protein